MLLKKTNIEEKLLSFKQKEFSETDIKNAITNLFREIPEIQKEATTENIFNFDLLETSRIYHISHIKKICIDYRLRFLDIKYFKGKVPSNGISEIKKIENQHKTTISKLKIVAPSKLFKLENADDPLLFMPLGNDYYYLIYKWGNDLHPFRKLLMLPFKNLLNLGILILLISAIFTMLLPLSLFTQNDSISTYIMLYFFIAKAIASVVLFYGISLGKNFNYAIWNSKYFNA